MRNQTEFVKNMCNHLFMIILENCAEKLITKSSSN